MIKAKKKFGQNFLRDENIKDKIIESIPDFPRLVEIGPGLGDLTRRLVLLGRELECFEIDSELCEFLRGEFASELASGRLALRNVDALEAWDEIAKSDYFLVANLPYYVATNIILRALDDERCKGLVVMIQLEVAQKFCAKAGEREFSSLALLAALYGECEIVCEVPASCFEPAPKVTSAVVRLVKNKTPKVDLAAFKGFLRVAFAAPRKTLLKNLTAFAPKPLLEQVFSVSGISVNARPHEVSLALYEKIFKEVTDERREWTK